MSQGTIVWYHPLWVDLQRELHDHHRHYWDHLQKNPMNEAGFAYWMNLQLDITMSLADVSMEDCLQIWLYKLRQKRGLVLILPPGVMT